MGFCCEPVDLQCLTLTLDTRLQAEAVQGMSVMFSHKRHGSGCLMILGRIHSCFCVEESTFLVLPTRMLTTKYFGPQLYCAWDIDIDIEVWGPSWGLLD